MENSLSPGAAHSIFTVLKHPDTKPKSAPQNSSIFGEKKILYFGFLRPKIKSWFCRLGERHYLKASVSPPVKGFLCNLEGFL